MVQRILTRRDVLTAGAMTSTVALIAAGPAAAQPAETAPAAPLPSGPTYPELIPSGPLPYEIQRTDEEWQAMLTEEEYRILRKEGTEPRRSNPLWEEERPGKYYCRGCGLHVYSGEEKVVLRIGWLFFKHGELDSVLLGIHESTNYGRRPKKQRVAQAHCRRCGSHFGHVLIINREILHCVNGTSFIFKPEAA